METIPTYDVLFDFDFSYVHKELKLLSYEFEYLITKFVGKNF